MVFEAAELHIVVGIGRLLHIEHMEIGLKVPTIFKHLLNVRPDVVIIGHVESAVEIAIADRHRTLSPHIAVVDAVDALCQPNGIGAHLRHCLTGTAPKFHRYRACHIAAETVHDLRPLHQRFDLIVPKRCVAVVEVDNIAPIRHTAGGIAIFIPQEELGMVVCQHGVGRGVVIDHINDELHPALVALPHQMLQILYRTHIGIHGTVVTDGVGAAYAALAVHLADGMDGHEPQNIHAERAQTVKVALQCAERTFGGMITDEHAVQHCVTQRQIRIFCHFRSPYCNICRNSSSVSTGIPKSWAFVSLLPAFSPATT